MDGLFPWFRTKMVQKPSALRRECYYISLVRIDAAVAEPPTLAFGARIAARRKAGLPVLSLGLGEPDVETPAHVIEAAHRAMRDGYTKYSAAAGLPELREAVAAKLARDNGIKAEAGEVVVVPGAKNALYLAAAALLEPGDEAVLLTPGYVSNKPIVMLAEPSCRIVEVPLRAPDFALDRTALTAAIGPKTRLLIANFPHNPTGRMLDAADAAFLAGLLRDNSRLHLISDEIYEKLAFGDRPMVSPAALPGAADRVITVNGFSKAYAMTGWRVGYAHAAKPLAARILRVHQQLNTNVAAFTQKAALAALTGPQEHLSGLVARLRGCREAYAAFLARNPGLAGPVPDGGLFGFVRVGASGWTSDAFCSALVEESGVAVLPGASFGPEWDAWCRVTLCGEPAGFASALDALGALAARGPR